MHALTLRITPSYITYPPSCPNLATSHADSPAHSTFHWAKMPSGWLPPLHYRQTPPGSQAIRLRWAQFHLLRKSDQKMLEIPDAPVWSMVWRASFSRSLPSPYFLTVGRHLFLRFFNTTGEPRLVILQQPGGYSPLTQGQRAPMLFDRVPRLSPARLLLPLLRSDAEVALEETAEIPSQLPLPKLPRTRAGEPGPRSIAPDLFAGHLVRPTRMGKELRLDFFFLSPSDFFASRPLAEQAAVDDDNPVPAFRRGKEDDEPANRPGGGTDRRRRC